MKQRGKGAKAPFLAWTAFAVSLAACGPTSTRPARFADAPDPMQQVADAGLKAFGAHAKVGEAEFSCQLRPALLNEARRHFDQAAWQQKWGLWGASLWVLTLEVESSSQGGLALSELTLECTIDGAVQTLEFRIPEKESGDSIVHDPLAVLLSAPKGLLPAGAREWIDVLGPETLVEPALRFGSERILLSPSTWESAKALDDLPLLHRPLSTPR